VHATGSAPQWTAGGALPFRFLGVPATWPLPRIVERLNRIDAPALAGYPTLLARLAEERRAGRLQISPRLITSTSETLAPPLRATISAGFGAPIVDLFGSTEGLVGGTQPDDDVVVFNSDVCIVEVVDERNRPVPRGVPSAKVLVTNLANRVQPLIRYEMRDSFVRLPGDERGWLRATVEGRADDVLRYPHVDVHPLALRHVFVTSPEVLDYQVRQTRHGVDVAALATCALDVAGLRHRLTCALEQAGLAEPQVTVQPVDSLERHHETGKVRRFVPLHSP
jgi:phenylacetate-coenzyme A ligase PaaK-like adenylate-forming protein